MEPAAALASQLNHLADRTAYVQAASQLLLGIFPGDSVARISLDFGGGTADAREYSARHPDGESGRWRELWDDHPILVSCLNDPVARMWAPRRLSDVASNRELRATRAYQVGIRLMGSDKQLAFLTSGNRRSNLGGWSLNRSGSDYTADDVALAGLVQPLLRRLDAVYDQQPEARWDLAIDSYGLTKREVDVMRLASRGLTATAIGHMLGVSPRTVGKHLEHTYAKLGCTNRIDALRRLDSTWSRASDVP